jgi:DNA-binding MarR family transcriptional regulator
MFTEDMSTPINRKELIEKLNSQVRDNGNINVLLVHAIAQHMSLSASEFECASLIRDHGPFTAGELAKRCHISTGGMTGMIDRLERSQLVRRITDPNDRRRVLVEGIENKHLECKAHELYEPMQKAFDEILDSYSDDEILFLVTFMERVNAMFHNAIENLPPK